MIKVTTVAKAAVGFNTYYSDGKNGARDPFGAGYGGNAGGFADGRGHYQSTWVVAPNAPVGSAYALVVVGSTTSSRLGQRKVPFDVQTTCL